MSCQNNAKLNTHQITKDTADLALDFDPVKAVDYLQEMSQTNSFFWYLQDFFDEEYRITPQHDEAAQKIQRRKQMQLLKDRAEELNKKLTEKSGQTLSVEPPPIHRWLNGEIDLHRGKSDWKQELGFDPTRETLYKLCGLLGFDGEKTESFFRRAAFFAPWNRKSWREVVYHFCISRNPKNWYEDSVKLIFEIETEQSRVQAAKHTIWGTYKIDTQLTQFQKTDDPGTATENLKAFILENWNTFRPENFRCTAYKEILALYEDCKPYVYGETTDPSEEKDAVHSMDEMSPYVLFSRILSGRTDRIKGENKLSLDQSILPKYAQLKKKELSKDMVKIQHRIDSIIEENNISGEDTVSDARLRKLLLLLNFYYSYARYRQDHCGKENRRHPENGYSCAKDRTADYSRYFEEFCDETNELLECAGFCTLYEGNALDCLFLLAAQTKQPITALREMVRTGQA